MLRRAWLVIALSSLPACPKEQPIEQSSPRSLAQLADAFDKSSQQPLAEAIKCRRLRDVLLSVGARPHALGVIDRVALPALLSDEALLSFFEHRDTLHRFLRVGRRDIELAPLSRRSLEPLIVRARDALELGELDQIGPLWRYLRRLHERLLDDVVVHLAERTRHLVVSADGLLRFLPLHVLRGKDERFVGARWQVRYLPCLALGERPTSKTSSSSVQVFLPSFGGTSKQPSKAAVREGETIAAIFDRNKRWIGAQASRERFIEALATANVVHFAGHGLPVPEPELLFGSESLTLAEATREPVKAELVVLASCATAYTARFRDGKKILARANFAEALLAAGASSVISASWAVKDEESARQMKAVYEGGLGRVYRERISAIRPPHPRFWGAYAVYGSRVQLRGR